ncbi:phosphate/phosphite/phosphonate ABC transporter substrate-binding protein [Pseudobdellovibrio exovorus]|uniref:Alkylphosphonate ABC transporter n=1 Tax=Pseudobdellovibrio exovorus JSS TaxID=1184267 RepID=M4VPC2_9BACT|nr:phosphate/phosphite/phosphonate ABC transporter substrate-binding protein [Pseudobdellovibrio exovorus]AGH94969.1 alkylphosphonate ABC transporter [Pseudobdellovibrio exovorus JSS]
MVKTAFLSVLFFSCLLFASTEKISIGILSGGNPQAVEKESLLLAQKLQNKLGSPIQVYIPKSPEAMVSAIKSKKVDLAILPSAVYVAADREASVKVLLKKTWNNGPFYYATFLTLANSKVKSLKDLKGKKVAFVDENSSSGYLYPRQELESQKINLKEVNTVFSGNHAASIEMLEAGKVDAVAVFADDEKAKVSAWSRFAKNKGKKIRVLWVSEPIPNDPIIVRQDYYDKNAKIVHEIMYNLIETQHESSSDLVEVLGMSALMPATSRQYDSVREVFKAFRKGSEL